MIYLKWISKNYSAYYITKYLDYNSATKVSKFVSISYVISEKIFQILIHKNEYSNVIYKSDFFNKNFNFPAIYINESAVPGTCLDDKFLFIQYDINKSLADIDVIVLNEKQVNFT